MQGTTACLHSFRAVVIVAVGEEELLLKRLLRLRAAQLHLRKASNGRQKRNFFFAGNVVSKSRRPAPLLWHPVVPPSLALGQDLFFGWGVPRHLRGLSRGFTSCASDRWVPRRITLSPNSPRSSLAG